MRKARFFIAVSFVLVLSILSPISNYGQELRPFDFNDSYYKQNGVNPKMIQGRRTGSDKFSVIDFIDSRIHRDVRIIGTWPVSDYKGDVMYFAPLGSLPLDGFTKDKAGVQAIEIANRFPIYMFPSSNVKNTERQAKVAETGKGFFDKNPLGLSIVINVEFTKKALSKEGQEVLTAILGKNGKTLDGTFAIRTIEEVNLLTWRGFVTQRMTGLDGKNGPSYMIKPVIKDPSKGAISPDAFLSMVLDVNRKPLVDEMVFVDNFKCLQKTGEWCG